MIANSFDEIEVLLVEDNKNDKELILRILKKHNFANKIFVVKNGEEALDYLFSTGQYLHKSIHPLPKLVILDLKLPKVSGLEVLEKIKSDTQTRMVPVVVFTSSQEEKDQMECYRLGTNSFVVKPINFERFVQATSEIGLYWLFLNKPVN